MKLHQEDLQKIAEYYAQYKNAENLEELYNGEMQKLLSRSYKDNRLDDYARGIAIAAATFQKRCQEDPSYAKKLTDLGYELASLGSGIENQQFEKVIKYRDKLNQIESINSLGEVETSDPEIQEAKTADESSFEDVLNDRIQNNPNELEFLEPEESSEFSVNPRDRLFGILKSCAVATDLDHPDKSVLFDHVFFNEILEEKEAILDRIKDKDFPFGDMAERDLDIGAVPEDVDPREAATFDASARIKTYMTLDKRSQNRSFLDVLKHPFNTFKEWRIKKNLEKDIEKRYGLDKTTLEKMTAKVLDTTHPKNKHGYEEMEKDFVAFSKDGTVISTETHNPKDVQRIGSVDYPKDPEFDAKIEARQKALQEKERAEEEPEQDGEELDTSKLANDTNLQKNADEKSTFQQKETVVLNDQVIGKN